MPYDWVEPDTFLVHKGFVVYYVYKDDEYQSGARDYWYSLKATGGDSDSHGHNGVFDIRELPVNESDFDTREALIVAAIDSGYFGGWEHDEPSSCEDCDGDGIRVTGRSNDSVTAPAGFVIIERCDTCRRHDSDLDAAGSWGYQARWYEACMGTGGTVAIATPDETGDSTARLLDTLKDALQAIEASSPAGSQDRAAAIDELSECVAKIECNNWRFKAT